VQILRFSRKPQNGSASNFFPDLGENFCLLQPALKSNAPTLTNFTYFSGRIKSNYILDLIATIVEKMAIMQRNAATRRYRNAVITVNLLIISWPNVLQCHPLKKARIEVAAVVAVMQQAAVAIAAAEDIQLTTECVPSSSSSSSSWILSIRF